MHASKFNIEGVLIGADPEFIVMDQDDNPAVAIGKIGGTKDKPIPVKYGALQEDNVLAEINIDPCATGYDFFRYIDHVKSQLRGVLGKSSLDLSSLTTHTFPREVIRAHSNAMQFGCSPDYNVYTGQPQMPNAIDMRYTRTAGGHVHISIPNVDNHLRERLVRTCDIFLGIPSVLLDPDTTRRQFYGKAGSYRPKDYGIEYRALSNFWVLDYKAPLLIHSLALSAVQDVLNGSEVLNKVYDTHSDMRIRNTIDSYNKREALRLCTDYLQGCF